MALTFRTGSDGIGRALTIDELDNNLIGAKKFLGITYSNIGDYDRAMDIFTSVL